MLFSSTLLVASRLAQCLGGPFPGQSALWNHPSYSALFCIAFDSKSHRFVALPYHSQTISALKMETCQREVMLSIFTFCRFPECRVCEFTERFNSSLNSEAAITECACLFCITAGRFTSYTFDSVSMMADPYYIFHVFDLIHLLLDIWKKWKERRLTCNHQTRDVGQHCNH